MEEAVPPQCSGPPVLSSMVRDEIWGIQRLGSAVDGDGPEHSVEKGAAGRKDVGAGGLRKRTRLPRPKRLFPAVSVMFLPL